MQNKQVDRGFEVANEDGDKPGKKQRRDVVDKSVASRHMAWLKKIYKQEAGESWRPRKQYRMAVKRWACHIDNQLQVPGGVNGLHHFAWDGNTEMWKDSNWRLWRHLTISMDLGSDGVAAMHALMYGFFMCLWLQPDPSHGCNRDVDLAICHLG